MGWIAHKLDSLAGAAVGALAAGAASQGQAFTNAYLQRLGGRLDEAAALLARAQDGTLLAEADPTARASLAADLAERVAVLQAQQAALLETPPLWRPFALLTDMDPQIAGAVLDSFVPALPLTAATAVHVAVGLLLGLLLWEGCKAPAIPIRRLRRRGQEARAREMARARARTGRREPAQRSTAQAPDDQGDAAPERREPTLSPPPRR